MIRFDSTLTIMMAACLVVCALPACAQPQAVEQSIADTQQRLSDKYDRLELLAGRLAELSGSTQPRRARLLREFVSQSRERDLTGRFETIVKALQQEKLASAVKDQDTLQSELQQLLELLLQEDRDTQIEAERKRIARYLSQLKKLIRKQSGIKSRTEGRDDQQELTDDQREAADATGSLSDDIKETEGTPEKSPADSGQPKNDVARGGQSSEADSQDGKSQSDDSESSQSSKNQAGQSKSGQQDSSKQDSKQAESSNSKDTQSSKKQNDGQGSQSQSPSKSGESQQGQSKQSDSQSGESQSGQSQAGQAQSGESQSGESGQQNTPQKPADRATQRLQQAQQRMQEAIEKLKEANHDDAIEAQEKALRELEQAKAELEKILRQLREEELERMLVLLEARFRKMLDAQVAVYEQTKEIHQRRDQVEQHELVISSARLSRKEKQIISEADRALVLLREDGTSVAFPEALEQAKQDMEAVAKRLSDVKLAAITQALEEDIIAALEETLAAFQQALKELRDKKSQPQQGGGQPPEQSLVDKLAELRMIRALQNRINRRTVLYGNMIEGEQALEDELLEALDELAQREERVYRATLDLHQGANQ